MLLSTRNNQGRAPLRLDSEGPAPITEENTVPRPTKALAAAGAAIEDAVAVYETGADEIDVVLRQIAAAHARDTQRRAREIQRLTGQRDRLRALAERARDARKLLPAGALVALTCLALASTAAGATPPVPLPDPSSTIHPTRAMLVDQRLGDLASRLDTAEAYIARLDSCLDRRVAYVHTTSGTTVPVLRIKTACMTRKGIS